MLLFRRLVVRRVTMRSAALATIVVLLMGTATLTAFEKRAWSASEPLPPSAQDHENPGALSLSVPSPDLSRLIASGAVDPARVAASGSAGFSIRRTGPLRPDGDARDFVRSLKRRSDAGDGTASYDIFLAVLDCRRLYDQVPAIEDDDAARRLGECESLLGDAALTDVDWLSRAVAQGSLEAKLLYAINPAYSLAGGATAYLADPDAVQKWRETSRRYLEEAVSYGSQDALLLLSNAYGAGVIVGQDRVAQFAYALAAQQIAPIDGFQQGYGSLRRSMTIEEQRSAELRAQTIRESCCKR